MKKKSSIQKIAAFILMIALGGAVGFLIGELGHSSGQDAKTISLPAYAMIAMPFLFTLSFLIVIAIHEGGHALVGVWMKFDFRMYVVGPFMWEKEQTGWQFKWNKNVNTMGGMVICLPSGNENLSKRFSLYAAGGPMASLVLAAFSYGVFLLLSFMALDGIIFPLLRNFFMITGLLSIVIFVVTAIPVHMGGFYSDGARILRLQRGGDKARFDVLTLKIITSSASGTRPKLLNISELDEALALANKLNEPFGVYLLSYFHQAAFDEGDMEKAEKYLLEYISLADAIPAGIRNAVWLDAALFYAIAKNDLEKATSYWNQFKSTAMIPKSQIFAVEAAINYLKNDRIVAEQKIESAIKELPNMMDKGVGIALGERLSTLKNNLNK
jgi:hypothetical protein